MLLCKYVYLYLCMSVCLSVSVVAGGGGERAGGGLVVVAVVLVVWVGVRGCAFVC